METEREEVTGEQVKQAMMKADIKEVEHHGCSLCGYMTKFVRIDTELFFDSGCDCVGGGPNLRHRPWDDAAEWINMQSKDHVYDRLKKEFGFTN